MQGIIGCRAVEKAQVRARARARARVRVTEVSLVATTNLVFNIRIPKTAPLDLHA